MLLVLIVLSLAVIPVSAYILTRRERARGIIPIRVPAHSMRTVTLVISLIALAFWWLFHPVCVPLSDADVREFARWAPIETRTDRQLLGPVFRQRSDHLFGRWRDADSGFILGPARAPIGPYRPDLRSNRGPTSVMATRPPMTRARRRYRPAVPIAAQTSDGPDSVVGKALIRPHR